MESQEMGKKRGSRKMKERKMRKGKAERDSKIGNRRQVHKII